MDPSLSKLTEEFQRLRQQKARLSGGIEGRVLLNLAFVLGEQYTSHRNNGLYAEKQDKNKLYLVFNLIAPRVSKLLGRLTATSMSFVAHPDKRDPESLSSAEVVNKLDRALDQKLVQPSRLWETLWWLLVGGTAFIYTPWVPDATVEPVPVRDEESGQPMVRVKATGQVVPIEAAARAIQMGAPKELFEIAEEVALTGEVGCEVLGPLNVFVDQSVRAVEDLAPDQMIFIAKIRTMGWVEANFADEMDGLTPDDEFQIVTTQFHALGDAVAGHYLKDLIPLVQGSASESGPDQVVVVEGYAPASAQNPRGRYVVFVPGKKILRDDINPYGDIPIVDFHWKPVTTSFWTEDYVGNLIAPQRFINKRMSQLGEQANASVYSHILFGGTLTAKDLPADWPGVIEKAISENGTPLVGRLAGPELPSWFMPATTAVHQLFNDIAGGQDLFRESKFPGQLRGSESVPMLQEILDTEWGPLFEHVGERLARVKQQRLNRVQRFYPATRTLHFVDKNQKDETLTFHKEQILGKGVNYNITIERSSLLPELRALREMRLSQRLSGPLAVLYLDERTGTWDKNKIAAELKFGDPGRESREARYRKLAGERIKMLHGGVTPPQVMPFYDHRVMLDELEAEMSSGEFYGLSPQIQQLFIREYEQHRQYLMAEAQQQQMAMQQGAVQNAVAQATQQAAAQAAAETVKATMGQMQAQSEQPTEEFVQESRRMVGNTGGGR